MIGYSSTIKQAVTMWDVLGLFGIVTNRHGRCQCPIHHGEDYNCRIRDKSFHCYVCGASGTVLDFVMQYMGTDLSGAERYLNDQLGLGLPLGREQTASERRELNKRLRAMRAEKERAERELERAQTAYDRAMDEWVRLDRIIHEKAPEGPLDAPSAEWCDAVKRIEQVWMQVQDADMELQKLEGSAK